jgi:phenylacetate-CoA ligase
LSQYNLDLIVGGEGLSEGLRTHLLKSFRTVISSYGASDLEINIGVETELTISLRRLCCERPELSLELFGRDAPPMIFQYNALYYIIETTDEGELIFTIGRQTSAAPKLRYNLHDLGGVIAHRELRERLIENGVLIEALAPLQAVFRCSMFLAVAILQSLLWREVYPTDIEAIIMPRPCFQFTNSFSSPALKMNRLIAGLRFI